MRLESTTSPKDADFRSRFDRVRGFLGESRGGARLVLGLVCVVWGSTFAINKLALQDIGVFIFLALRFLVGYLVLAGYGIWRDTRRGRPFHLSLRPSWPGVFLGVLMFLAYALQNLGLLSISPSTSGFVTGISVVLVPLLGFIVGSRPKLIAVVSALGAFLGLVLLSLPLQSGRLIGEILTLGCAVAAALQLLFTEKMVTERNLVSLVLTQLGTVAVLSGLTAVVVDTKPLQHSLTLEILTSPVVLIAIVVNGVVATAIAYLAQTHYQRHLPSTEIAVILNLEPLFATLFGFVLIGSHIGILGVAGGLVILASMMIDSKNPSGRKEHCVTTST